MHHIWPSSSDFRLISFGVVCCNRFLECLKARPDPLDNTCIPVNAETEKDDADAKPEQAIGIGDFGMLYQHLEEIMAVKMWVQKRLAAE